ncbi:MAG: hypothetical protein QNK03_19740 [Myxococcota bacterium]|nr:hypothetical protein [Myxococcota bacterium]
MSLERLFSDVSAPVADAPDRALSGHELAVADAELLLDAQGADLLALMRAGDVLPARHPTRPTASASRCGSRFEQNKAVVREMWAALGRFDFEALKSCRIPRSTTTHRGRGRPAAEPALTRLLTGDLEALELRPGTARQHLGE